MSDWSKTCGTVWKKCFEEMDKHEKFVEDLLAGAWDRHSVVKSERTEKTLNRSGKIREEFFNE